MLGMNHYQHNRQLKVKHTKNVNQELKIRDMCHDRTFRQMTWQELADEYGYASAATARQAVVRFLEDNAATGVVEMRAEINTIYQAIIQSYIPTALESYDDDGQRVPPLPKHTDVLLRTLKDYARLNGLYDDKGFDLGIQQQNNLVIIKIPDKKSHETTNEQAGYIEAPSLELIDG